MSKHYLKITTIILSLTSELIFVAGAITIWSENIYLIALLFGVIGIAKYQFVTSVFNSKKIKALDIIILIPLICLSFIVHLSFFTNISENTRVIKKEISAEVKYLETSTNIIKSGQRRVYKSLESLDKALAEIPPKYVTKRLQLIDKQTSQRTILNAKAESLDIELLTLNKQASTQVKKEVNTASSLYTLSLMLNKSVEDITMTLNVIIASIIDIFALYLAYVVNSKPQKIKPKKRVIRKRKLKLKKIVKTPPKKIKKPIEIKEPPKTPIKNTTVKPKRKLFKKIVLPKQVKTKHKVITEDNKKIKKNPPSIERTNLFNNTVVSVAKSY